MQTIRGAVRLAAIPALAIALQVSSSPALAPTGRVVGIVDGDTIDVLIDGKPTRVRVEGIDCPESGQPFSKRAKQLSSSLVFDRDVRLEGDSLDRYGRRIARVRFRDDEGLESDLSLRLVGTGLAWHFKRYSADATLAGAERTARERKRGLWADPAPVPPWEHRSSLRGTKKSGEPKAVATAVGAAFSGNRNSHVFHRASCRHSSCPNCVRGFPTRAEAIDAGFRPCGLCKP